MLNQKSRLHLTRTILGLEFLNASYRASSVTSETLLTTPQSCVIADAQHLSEVFALLTPQESELLNLVVQRSVVDAQFRQELLSTPQQTLQEAGIQTDGITVDVREIDENKLVLVLPPIVEFSEPTESRNPYTDQPSSPHIRGMATTAVANPLDERVALSGPNGTRGE